MSNSDFSNVTVLLLLVGVIRVRKKATWPEQREKITVAVAKKLL